MKLYLKFIKNIKNFNFKKALVEAIVNSFVQLSESTEFRNFIISHENYALAIWRSIDKVEDDSMQTKLISILEIIINTLDHDLKLELSQRFRKDVQRVVNKLVLNTNPI